MKLFIIIREGSTVIVENTEGLRVVCNMDLQLCSGNILQNGVLGPNISAVRKRVTSVGQTRNFGVKQSDTCEVK